MLFAPSGAENLVHRSTDIRELENRRQWWRDLNILKVTYEYAENRRRFVSKGKRYSLVTTGMYKVYIYLYRFKFYLKCKDSLFTYLYVFDEVYKFLIKNKRIYSIIISCSLKLITKKLYILHNFMKLHQFLKLDIILTSFILSVI